MADKRKKAKETILMIRIPDDEARHGEASLTIQRGDLGIMRQFTYSGLTLKGNIAEAVQAAIAALAQLEVTPPPSFNTSDTPAASETVEASTEGSEEEPIQESNEATEVVEVAFSEEAVEEPPQSQSPEPAINPTPELPHGEAVTQQQMNLF
jgi:hypothetical protein